MEKHFSTKRCYEVIAPLLSDYVFLCDRLHEVLEDWNRMVAERREMLIRRRGRSSMVDVEGGTEPRLDQVTQGYWNCGNVVAVRTYRQGTLSLAD